MSSPNNIFEYMNDLIESTSPDKSLHSWPKSTTEVEYVISHLTVGENQVIFDPFMGSGTTGIATLKLKRKFTGIEIDSEKFRIAESNIINFLQKQQQQGQQDQQQQECNARREGNHHNCSSANSSSQDPTVQNVLV